MNTHLHLTHEAFLQDIIDHLPDGLIVINEQGTLLSYNPAAERIFAYAEQEVLGRNISMLMPEPYKGEHDGYVRNYLITGEKHIIDQGREVIGRRKDGSTLPLHLSVSEMRIEGQSLFIGIVHDLSGQKNTERQIRKSEERFRATFEQAAVGIVHITTDGRFLRVNQRFCHIVGYTRQELQERTLTGLTYHEDRTTNFQYVKELLQNHRKAYSMEKRYCRKNGSLVWVNITMSLLRSEADDTEYFIGVVEDITEKRLTEKQLYINEERLKLALDASNDALWDWIIPENRSYWSPSYYTMLGYAPDEFLPNVENFRRLLHPEDRERVLTLVTESARKGEIYQTEFRLKHKSGGWQWIFSRGKVVEWDRESRPVRMIGTHVDITERKQAEEELKDYRDRLEELVEQRTQELRESEERQRAQYKGIPVPTYTWQKQGEDFVLVDYNDAAEQITQGNIAHFVGVTASTLYAEQPEFQEDMRRCAATGLSIEKNVDYEFKTLGKLKHLQVKYAFVPPDLVLVHTEDITTRKQAERALQESEARFRTLVDSMDDVIFTLDRDQRHSGVFGHWIENQGFTREMFLGKRSREILGPEAALVHEKANEEALSGKNVVYDWSAPQPDGSLLHFQTSLSPMRNEQGQVLGLVGVGRDITERKLAAEALEHAKNEAEQANRAKSEFLANMSHELRTPLNAILGFAQLMQRDSSIPPEQQENLRIITRSGEHLLQLINDVLEMSKIEAGRETLNPVDFDLYALLKDLAEMFRFRAGEKSIGLSFDVAPDLPQYIRSDERKLRQILLNLLSNAVRFTEQGEVRMTVTGEQCSVNNEHHSGIPEQQALTAEHGLAFTVRDTGPGIPEEELDMLFEAFSQTTSGRKSGSGSGLGLALSQQFAELLGGELRVETREAQGSTFIFGLTVELAESETLREQVPARSVSGLESGQPDYRILIVDDNFESRKILRELLRSIGFINLREAGNGREGIEQFRRWHPDFIWMDMRMATMDGYEATRRIRRIEKNLQSDADTHVPIVAFTANAFEEQRAAVLEAGCDDMLSKPFHEADVFAVLKKFLHLRYCYEDAEPSPQKFQSDSERSGSFDTHADSFTHVPQELISQIERAAERSNMRDMIGLLERLRRHDADLAQTLGLLADDFAYDKILALLQGRE